MEFQVIYFSRKGSTKKIADAIADELKIEAEDVKKAKIKDNVFIFLGSGCYGGKPGKYMTNFIEKYDFSEKKVALYGTSGGGEGKETEVMETQLNDKNAIIKGKFFCKGKFWFGNKDKPSNEDLDNARKFAKQMVK